MKELDEAIFSLFNTANTLNTALSNNLFPGSADEETPFPYCIHNIISNNPDFWFTEYFEEILIQFSLFSDKNSPVEINSLYGYLTNLFDDVEISISGWETVRFERIESKRIRDNVQKTWAYHITYNCLIEQ